MRLRRPAVFETGRATQADEAEQAAQVEAWERHNADALVALECQLLDDLGFEALEANLQLEQVHLARVRATRHVVERPVALVDRHPTGSLAVYAALRGDAVLEYGGRRRVLRPGQVVVCDADRPFVRSFGHGLEELAVKVPLPALAERTGRAALAEPVVIDAGPTGDRYGKALVRLVAGALRGDQPVPAEEEAVLDLVAVIASEGRVAPATAHRAVAKAYIEERLCDASLSAADVAVGAGISARHLSRLFAESGTSVPRHILGRRLDLAYSMLAGGAPDLRTAAVAERCGFTSVSYFSQAFGRRFGVAAGDVRRAVLT